MRALRGAWVGILLVLVTVPLPASGQAGISVDLTPDERAWVEEHGPIRYGYNLGFAPFTLVDKDGAVRGINRDLLRLMSVDLGLEFEMVQTANFSDTLQRVASGEVHLAGNLGRSPEREETMAFTTPYAFVHNFLWANEGVILPVDLAGSRIAVVGRTAGLPMAQAAWPDAELLVVDEVRPGLEAVREGRADAFVGTDAVVNYILLQEGWFELAPYGEPIDERAFAFAVPVGEPTLLAIMQKGLDAIGRAERAAIFVKWTGRDLNAPLPPDMDLPLRTLLMIGGVAVAAAGVVLFPAWILALRRSVTRRTQEVERLNATLERRVGQRTAQLAATNRALEASTREMESFAYTVSHDLKAPLRAMDGFSKSLLDEAPEGLSPAQRADLVRIRQAAQRMGQLIEDLLDLSRVGRAPMNRREVDVSALAREVAKETSATPPPHDVEFVIHPALRAHADPVLLHTVLQELIGNAWKFTSRKEHATIEVGVRGGADGEEFFVRDDGAGFDPEYGDQLFAPFRRLHGAREFGGEGIGLAKVRRIVARHGGATRAEGAPGKGATFSFTIPASEQEQEMMTP